MSQQKQIYLDNAATTPLYPEALDAMMPYLTSEYGNPSAVYGFARNARKAVENAREEVAKSLNADPSEIVFTSSGTEANNWAISELMQKGGHIITSIAEHHAVGHVCESLKRQGKNIEVTYLPVDDKGFVCPQNLKSAIRSNTVLISIMWANNEIGTIQPIAELSAIAKENGVLFHTDAVQAVGHIPIDLALMSNVDILTMSAHKFGGPKGVGALYIRKGTKLHPMIYGGAQEKNRRAGTENVTGIVGMGKALTISINKLSEEYNRVSNLRDMLIKQIEDAIPKVKLNGAIGKDRLPGNVNFSFDYIEGESLLLLLDMNGFCASSGSACSSASLEPSHVLLALGMSHEQAHGSIRFSLGDTSTEEDINMLTEVLPKLVKQLRDMSPLSEGVEF